MILDRIIENCGVVRVSGPAGVEVTAVCSDSRQVCPGALFIAVKGFAGDGHKFIARALAAGAAAVMYEDAEELAAQQVEAGEELAGKAVYVQVGNSRRAVAMAADAFYGHPSRELTLVGITGTNGKTTTVTLLYNLFRRLGYKCGLLSTIANYVDGTML